MVTVMRKSRLVKEYNQGALREQDWPTIPCVDSL
jgi:hypothetical protein